MIDKTFGYYIKCDRCYRYVLDRKSTPKMFYNRNHAVEYAFKKGWATIPLRDWFCPECVKEVREDAYYKNILQYQM